MADVRRTEPGDGPLLRVLRLRALETDPLAFSSTFARELAWHDEWEAWAVRHASGEDEATFLAVSDDGVPAGLAGAFRDEAVATRFELFSMWVAPEHRRAGHAAAIVEAVVEWARASGGHELLLSVTEPGAQAFYARCGFRADGRDEPLPHTPAVTMVGMRRALH
ncbi:MAG: GNAT family N-acetyltransferase [Gaiellales bacterium]